MGAVFRTMHWRRWNICSFIAPLIPAARRQYVAHTCLFVVNFGLHCLVPVWKKGSLGLDLPSPQPCARLMRNIWPDYVHPLRRLAIIEQSGAHPLLGRIRLSCRISLSPP
jgi:hypothetical protein